MSKNWNGKLNFTQNWNGKLDQDIFTTIRKDTGVVYNIETIFDIHLKHRFLFQAKIIDCELLPFIKITRAMVIIDTGVKHYSEALTLFNDFGIDTEKDNVWILLLKIL